LASAAGAGEVLVSREAAASAGVEVAGLEARQLTLKGKSQAQAVYVLPMGPD
jgi:class 3 adenylate cyclase